MQICFRASNKEKWYIDSGCSRHLTGDKEKFNSLEIKEGAKVSFGGNQSGRITGVGQVHRSSQRGLSGRWFVS